MNNYLCFSIASIMLLALPGCETIPKDALRLSPESLENRELQTRKYEGISEADILAASAGVMQDLGFNIDESETKLGVIVGSKDRSAVESQQVIGAITLAILLGADVPWDKVQKIRLSIVVRPVQPGNNSNYFVRVTFHRIVWNTRDQVSRAEVLNDPAMYQEFFDRFSKAIFLEGHKI